MTALHRLGVAALRCADAVAVTEHHLARIEAFDPALMAFTAVDAAGARAAAAESAARIAAGAARPLEGVPVGVKANIAVKGLATTAGVESRRGAVAAEDAAVVAALRAAGAVILGHLNMHEGALGATTDNPFYGRTENPHCAVNRPGRTPGGSSGGSGAAVAAGLCTLALGTDTLGSVRIPAAYCGVYGLKPGAGRLSQAGMALLAARLDTVGPLARSVADLAAVMAVLAPLGPARTIRSFGTLAVVEAADMEPAVRDGYARARDALAALGLAERVLPPDGIDLKMARVGGFLEAAREGAVHFAADRAAGGISAEFAGLLDFGLKAAPALADAGAEAAAQARTAVLAALAGCDVLLLPTTPQAAFVHGAAPVTQADFTALANLAGVPALSMPAGVDRDGLPVAVQLVGRAGDEGALLAVAAQLDGALGSYVFPKRFE